MQRKKPALRASKRAKMYFVRDQPNRYVLYFSFSLAATCLQSRSAEGTLDRSTKALTFPPFSSRRLVGVGGIVKQAREREAQLEKRRR